MKSFSIKILKIILLLLVVTIAVVIFVVTQPVFVGSETKERVVNSDTLKKHVYMMSETIPNKTLKENLLNVNAQYIFDEVSNLVSNVKYQNYDVKGVNYKNIVIEFAGKNDCGSYVVGAHYDTYGSYPGADDNMSGVAGLIELIRLFASKPPSCDLIMVFYSLEEPPYFRSEHMGSYIHAKSLSETKTNVEMMLSLETIGYFSDEPNSQDYPINGMQYMYSDKGNYITLVGDLSQIGITRFLKKHMLGASDLPVFSINAPVSIQGIDFSDHLNYWEFGYHALMITDTAFNRNEHYHTEFDTADRLDYKRMAKVIDGVYYALIAHMAQI